MLWHNDKFCSDTTECPRAGIILSQMLFITNNLHMGDPPSNTLPSDSIKIKLIKKLYSVIVKL